MPLYFRDLPAPEKATNPEEAPPTVAGGPIKVGPAGAAAVGLELLLREEVRDDEGEGAGEEKPVSGAVYLCFFLLGLKQKLVKDHFKKA